MPQQTDILSSRTAADSASDLAEQRFLVLSLLSRVRTCLPVRVVACTAAGAAAAVGRVDVQPLVQQVDGDGKAWPHGTIYNLPYLRQQGGANAVICDPQPDDIGLIAACDRDISAVKASGGEAPPGSRRRHDLSDSVYLHTIIGAAPTQFVRFYAGGIEAVSPGQIRAQAPTIILDGNVTITGSATIGGDLSVSGAGTVSGDLAAQGISLHNHVHPVGSGTTGTPQ